MTKGSHPWGAGSISKRLFPLSEDAMRHLENGTAAMFGYLIHDGRKTIEFEELSTLIPQAWSINNNKCERTKQYRRAVWFNGETGKVHPVPAPREHKLNTYRVRSLSPTPVVMSDGPSPLFDPPHTIDEKETPSIANCWRSNEKNEESRDKNQTIYQNIG